jgi:hypothetical protein
MTLRRPPTSGTAGTVQSDLEIVIEPADAPVPVGFTTATKIMFGVAAKLLEGRGLAAPETRIVVTGDLLSALAGESARLGLAPDRREGLERVGGALAGKCLRSTDGLRANILVPLELAVPADDQSQLFVGGIVGHELGHLVCDTARDAEVESIEGVWLPWEVAGVVALLAAAEFRADQIGHLLADAIYKPTDGEGNPVGLSSITGLLFRDGLPGALDVISPGVQETIWQYRTHQMTLETMWNAVVQASEGIALYLAHAQATNLGDLITTTVDHPATKIVEPVWRPLYEYLMDGPMLVEAGAWQADRLRLQEIGRDGFTEMWRRLGLVVQAAGDGFHLSVTDPPSTA